MSKEKMQGPHTILSKSWTGIWSCDTYRDKKLVYLSTSDEWNNFVDGVLKKFKFENKVIGHLLWILRKRCNVKILRTLDVSPYKKLCLE